MLRPGFRERICRGSLRYHLRHPGLGTASRPRDGLQFTRVGYSAVPSAPYRQRDLRGHLECPGDHHPSAKSIFRAKHHRTLRRRTAAFSQRRQHGSYKRFCRIFKIATLNTRRTKKSYSIDVPKYFCDISYHNDSTIKISSSLTRISNRFCRVT